MTFALAAVKVLIDWASGKPAQIVDRSRATKERAEELGFTTDGRDQLRRHRNGMAVRLFGGPEIAI